MILYYKRIVFEIFLPVYIENNEMSRNGIYWNSVLFSKISIWYITMMRAFKQQYNILIWYELRMGRRNGITSISNIYVLL